MAVASPYYFIFLGIGPVQCFWFFQHSNNNVSLTWACASVGAGDLVGTDARLFQEVVLIDSCCP